LGVLTKIGDASFASRLVSDATASLLRVSLGIGIGAVGAVAFAVIAFSMRPIGRMLFGITEILRPIPPIAWTPVAILVFGIGNPRAIAIVAVGAFSPIWFSLLSGLDGVREEHMKAALSLGADQRTVLLRVVVPTVLPFFMNGLRLGVGLGWYSVVAAEMMGISSGLGHGVVLFGLNIEMEAVFGYLAAIGLIGAAINALILQIEQKVVAVPARSHV
jgi:ABC-type nitrate/sulfonate/bicarbonate transport system permease component